MKPKWNIMSLLNILLEDIKEADLIHLIDEEITEKKVLEYKSQLPSSSDEDKKKFLATISSFANAIGGDIIYGMVEDRTTGKPKELEGIKIENVDQEILRLEQIIRDGIEPNIPSSSITTHPILLKSSGYALIIRVGRSWLSPHRISYKTWDRFYSRSTNGKYRLDIQELKSAFILSNTIGEKINNFREKRISDIYANKLPIPFYPSPKLVLHLIPLTAFYPGQNYDLDISLYDIQPIKTSNFEHRYNIDGLLTYGKFNNAERSFSYTQLFRNGIIEAVNSEVLWAGSGEKIITITYIEDALIDAVPTYMNVFERLHVDLPAFLFITLVDVKGFTIPLNRSWGSNEPYPIDRDIVLIPEFMIEKINFDPCITLKPVFDCIWNACGYRGSFNYDREGNRIKSSRTY